MVNKVAAATDPTKMGWIDTLKLKFNMESFVKNKDKMITLLFYLGAGFLAGFLVKRFFKYVLILAALVAGVCLLEYCGIIHVMVDWDKANEILGVKAIPKVDGSLLSFYWQWIQVNWAVSISAGIGFIIGWKVS